MEFTFKNKWSVRRVHEVKKGCMRTMTPVRAPAVRGIDQPRARSILENLNPPPQDSCARHTHGTETTSESRPFAAAPAPETQERLPGNGGNFAAIAAGPNVNDHLLIPNPEDGQANDLGGVEIGEPAGGNPNMARSYDNEAAHGQAPPAIENQHPDGQNMGQFNYGVQSLGGDGTVAASATYAAQAPAGEKRKGDHSDHSSEHSEESEESQESEQPRHAEQLEAQCAAITEAKVRSRISPDSLDDLPDTEEEIFDADAKDPCENM
ncbi:hypothetical protein B0T20DRAFT_495750 [Sordaria brevicollis]|uniref:Uncharacterized protein n=1 Tax=Sordaria brevicollis TaxID=83679 RepID=A0AAE0PGP2_SORBR|nr:hypothetical protein B0T20DRAFT_495750 [Sordaria brevicollis]